jgi:ribonuclease HI
MRQSTNKLYLYSECRTEANQGRWRFVLREADGSPRLVAEHVEPLVSSDRLELLSVVRGLEALDEPSHVTLMTSCTYVREGIRHGLAEWRSNGWRWERFGQMVPIKDLDLWQRVDRAMQFHQVDCRTYRIDAPHHQTQGPAVSLIRARRHSNPRLRRSKPRWFSVRRGLQYVLSWIAGWIPRRTLAPAR